MFVRIWATERGSVALMALLVAVPPIMAAPLMAVFQPDIPVLAWLDAGRLVNRVESPVVAGHIVRPLEDLLAWAPGLLSMWAFGRKRQCQSTLSRTLALRLTLIAACMTVIVAGLLHAVFDLPTGEIARPEVIAKVSLRTKVIDVALNSFGPGILEEYYYREGMYVLLRQTFGARATVAATALAFAACHPVELVPWALVFGLFCGVIRERTKHVGPTMAIHTIWNAVAYADAWLLL